MGLFGKSEAEKAEQKRIESERQDLKAREEQRRLDEEAKLHKHHHKHHHGSKPKKSGSLWRRNSSYVADSPRSPSHPVLSPGVAGLAANTNFGSATTMEEAASHLEIARKSEQDIELRQAEVKEQQRVLELQRRDLDAALVTARHQAKKARDVVERFRKDAKLHMQQADALTKDANKLRM